MSARLRGVFCCTYCNFEVPYDYFGEKPKYDHERLQYLEPVFALRSPFSGATSRSIAVGALCCECGRQVCLQESCSIFFTKRFCRDCIVNNRDAFPPAERREILKLFTDSTSCDLNIEKI
eukprot:GHVL01004159.1.p1 GENE.GHVL01004159.1~~GHVL01004159.1.p1  ORF type:complete len:120 (-),score=11.83 GHVL01004159.1:118-477(-)